MHAEDISSEYRPGGECLFEYFEGGLEAGVEFKCGYCGNAGKLLGGRGEQLQWEGANADEYAVCQFLFLEPNASDPLNKEAAEDLKNNREGFKRNVRSAMGGGSVKGQSYERVLK